MAVALRGTMWRYPEPSKVKNCSFFSENPEKSKISQDLAVALCGAILNPQKLRIVHFFRFLGKSRKVKTFSGFGCGAMWRYPEPSKVKIFSIFAIFGKIPKSQEILKIWLWRYVALCGAILNPQKVRFFHFFRFLGKSRKVKKFSRFGCGAMWRYPEP